MSVTNFFIISLIKLRSFFDFNFYYSTLALILKVSLIVKSSSPRGDEVFPVIDIGKAPEVISVNILLTLAGIIINEGLLVKLKSSFKKGIRPAETDRLPSIEFPEKSSINSSVTDSTSASTKVSALSKSSEIFVELSIEYEDSPANPFMGIVVEKSSITINCIGPFFSQLLKAKTAKSKITVLFKFIFFIIL